MFRYRSLRVVVIGIVTLTFLLACSPPEPSETAQWTIEANLYSGRQNPQGSLTAEQGTELLTMMAVLVETRPVELGGLGYSGFTLRPAQTAGTDIQTITLYNGTVTVTRSGTTSYLADPGRSLERWLFAQVENGTWLSGGEKQLIRNELPPILQG